MKDLLFGDVHIFPSNEFSKPTEDGRTTHLQNIIYSFEWIMEQALAYQVSRVIFMGDLWESTGHIDSLSLDTGEWLVNRLLDFCGEKGIDFRALLGNHDLYSEKHNIHHLKFLPGGLVFEHPWADPNLGIIYLPYRGTYNPDRFANWYRALPENVPWILYSHLDYLGARLNRAKASVFGLAPAFLSDLGIRLIFNGHYHVPRDEVHGDLRLVQVGSLLSRTFKDEESGVPRGAVLYNSETGTVTRLENPHSERFEILSVSDEGDLASLRAAYGDSERERTNLRVACPDYLEDACRDFAKPFRHHRLEVRSEASEASRSGVSAFASPAENVKLWVESQDVAGLDKDKLVKIGVHVVTEAASAEKMPNRDIAFSSLRLENFLSTEVLDVPLGAVGLILVDGTNGTGKSVACVDGLLWTVYGTNRRGLPVNGMIRTGQKWCMGKLSLVVDGDDYEILRTRNHPDDGSTVKLFKNGTDISARVAFKSPGCTQEMVERLVAVDEATLCQLCVLGNEFSDRFTRLGDFDRKRLFEQLCGLSLYQRSQDIAKSLADTRGKGVDDFERDFTNLVRSRDSLRSQLDAAQADLDKARSLADERAAKIDVELDEGRKVIESLLKNSSLHREALSAAEAERDKLEGVRRGMEEDVRSLNSTLGAARERMGRNQALASSEKEILEKGACPVCGSAHDPVKHTARLSEIERDLSDNKAIVDDCRAKIAEKEEKGRAVGLALGKNREALRSRRVEMDRITAEVERLRGLEAGAQRRKDSLYVEGERIEARLSLLRSQFADAESAMIEKEQALIGLKRDRNHYDWWVKGFAPSQLRAHVLGEYLDLANRYLEDYSRSLFGDRSARFTTVERGSDFKIDVEIPGDRRYGSYSSGQRRRIDLAVQLALNEVASKVSSVRFNYLACDEVDSFLDGAGLAGLVDILGRKADDGRAVRLSTQNPALKSMVPRKWTMRLENGITKMAVE